MSHKSYQSTLPCSNKLLQKRWDDTYYQEHRKLVHTAKPMVDTKAPPVHPHVISKWKKQQIEKERAGDIERDNTTLMRKMQRIMLTEGSVDHKNTYRHHSLNDLKRQRELERVAKENKQMLSRLQKVEPMYKVSDWIDDWQKKEELTDRITAYPEGPPTLKSKTLPLDRAASALHSRRLAKTTAPSSRREGRQKPVEIGGLSEEPELKVNSEVPVPIEDRAQDTAQTQD